MSLWDYLFDSEFTQRADIEALRESSESMQTRLDLQGTDQRARVTALEREVGELALVCRALLTVLRESGAVRPERLCEVMESIDLEDDVVDGQVTPESERRRRRLPPRCEQPPPTAGPSPPPANPPAPAGPGSTIEF